MASEQVRRELARMRKAQRLVAKWRAEADDYEKVSAVSDWKHLTIRPDQLRRCADELERILKPTAKSSR